MVYRGRPSRGCEACRKASVKCDEKRPGCSRCLRLKKSCDGYRKVDELRVLDETGRTRSKCLQRRHGRETRLNPLMVDLMLGPMSKDAVVWYFYYSTMATLTELDHSYHIHSELPKMYTSSHAESALCLSTQAIAHAAASRAGKSTLRNARRSYGLAISALNITLQDPRQAVADETLYAVLLLCGYETITCDSDKLTGWTAHVRGAAALLVHRSRQRSMGGFGAKLYQFARRSIIMCHMQTGTPATIPSSLFRGSLPPDENAVDQLFSLMSRLSEIQHSLQGGSVSGSAKQRKFVGELRAETRSLQRDFLHWQANLSPAWRYNVLQNLHHTDSGESEDREFVLVQLHRYPDTYTARLWNLYRTSRIILYFVMDRVPHDTKTDATATSHLSSNGPARFEVLHLVSDICASVPYLLGQDPTSWKPARVSGMDSQRKRSFTIPNQTNGQDRSHSLLWPLYVASGVDFIPEPQRAWISRQIESMAESGEPLASRLVDRQSQTLRGGTEPFAFDCV